MDDYDAAGTVTNRSRPFVRALLILAIGFLAGMIATGYTLTHWDAAARFVKTGDPSPPAAALAPVPVISRQLTATPAPPSASQAMLDRRVATIETRIASIDARAQAAVGNADRAEGLLVAFAARRALDRGVQLGYIETLLRDRFGGSQPQAVATILSAAHQPVTLDQLQDALDAAAPGLVTRSAQESWWQGLRRELGGLVVVRRGDTPSTAPRDRLSRAREMLHAGNVEGALAEVARMPGRASAATWITLARRYVSARSALDMIETAALLTPRDPAAAPTVWPVPLDPAAEAQPSPSDIRLSR
jgi:hypothetical protein